MARLLALGPIFALALCSVAAIAQPLPDPDYEVTFSSGASPAPSKNPQIAAGQTTKPVLGGNYPFANDAFLKAYVSFSKISHPNDPTIVNGNLVVSNLTPDVSRLSVGDTIKVNMYIINEKFIRGQSSVTRIQTGAGCFMRPFSVSSELTDGMTTKCIDYSDVDNGEPAGQPISSRTYKHAAGSNGPSSFSFVVPASYLKAMINGDPALSNTVRLSNRYVIYFDVEGVNFSYYRPLGAMYLYFSPVQRVLVQPTPTTVFEGSQALLFAADVQQVGRNNNLFSTLYSWERQDPSSLAWSAVPAVSGKYGVSGNKSWKLNFVKSTMASTGKYRLKIMPSNGSPVYTNPVNVTIRPISFATHVKSIFTNRCASCHYVGNPAPNAPKPFSNFSYSAVVLNDALFLSRIAAWDSDPTHTLSANPIVLPISERNTISNWLEGSQSK